MEHELFLACENGDEKEFLDLVNKGADVKKANTELLLHTNIFYGEKSIVKTIF